jgi:hypothetical protein
MALVVCVGVGVDVSSLSFMVLSGGAFLLGASGLLFGLEPLSFRFGGLFLGGDVGLFGVSAGLGGLVAVRGGGGAALVEVRGALAPGGHDDAGAGQHDHGDDEDHKCRGCEEWHPAPGGSGNPAYTAAVAVLDEDMAQYIHDNTDDEISHAAFINAYLKAHGARTVNLDKFRTLPSSKATGAQQIGRLTNLMQLTVNTSF